MSREKYSGVRFTCDNCSVVYKDECDVDLNWQHQILPHGWVHVSIDLPVIGKSKIVNTTERHEAEFCSACLVELREFFNKGSA